MLQSRRYCVRSNTTAGVVLGAIQSHAGGLSHPTMVTYSPVVIEREIAVQPENIENRLDPIADHRPVASKSKRNETLDVFCQM